MNPSRSSDQTYQAYRGQGCREKNAGTTLIEGFLVLIAVYGAGIVSLAAAPELSSGKESAEGLDSRAEVYVDRFYAPDSRLRLPSAGRLRGEALAHYSRALAYESRKDMDGALGEYKEVLRLMPGNIKLARKVAILLASGGNKEEARNILEKALELNPELAQAYLVFSEYLLTYHAGSQEDRERSLALAEEALDKFPEEAAVYDHLVRLYLVGRKAEKAKATIEKALQRSSEDPYFWLRIAAIAQRVWPLDSREGQEPVLLNGIYQKALDHAGDRAAILEAVAGYYHSSHQPEKARVLYEKIISDHPDKLQVRKKLALVYQILGQQDKVIETYRSVIQIDPRDVGTYKVLCEIYKLREDPDNAAYYLQQALKINKGSESEYLDLAQLLLAARRPEESATILERAAYYYPEDPRITFMLAISHTSAKQYEASVSAFEKTVQLGKEAQPGLLNERFYFQYGAAAERAGQLDRAAELFRKSMELLARNGSEDSDTKEFTAQVYNYLGYMWLENDMNIDEAGELIKTAFELNPGSGAIRDSLGWFYFKKKKFEEARRELTAAMSMMEEPDPVVFDHLAQAYFHLGMKTEALDYMKKAIELDSANKDFIDRLKKYEKEEPPVPRPLPKTPPVEKKEKPGPAQEPEPVAKPVAEKAA